MINKKRWFYPFVMLYVLPVAKAQDTIGPIFITLSVGSFCTLAFFAITFILWKNDLEIGHWILLSFATLFITISEFFRVLKNSLMMHQLFLTASIIVSFVIALIKFWDTLELTE